jgi:hypothetical protein
MPASQSSFYLRFLLHEDEAQILGMEFTPMNGGKQVRVQGRYNHPEYEQEPELHPVAKAREIWKKLIDSGDWVRVR